MTNKSLQNCTFHGHFALCRQVEIAKRLLTLPVVAVIVTVTVIVALNGGGCCRRSTEERTALEEVGI